MSRRVDISAFRYAIISASAGQRRQIVALSNDISSAHTMACDGGWHVVPTKELDAFKINSYVGRDHAASSHIGYDTVDPSTNLESRYI